MLTALEFITAYVFLAPYVLVAATMLILLVLDFSSVLLTIGTFILIGSAVLTFHVTSLAALWASLPYLAGGIVFYVIAGFGWVHVAWASFYRRVDERYEDYREARLPPFLTSYKIANLQALVPNYSSPSYAQELWADKIKHHFGFSIPILVREHKARIIRWMMYWPFSILRWLLDDPIRRFYNHLYRSVAGRMQAAADKAMAKHASDFQS